MRGSGTVREAAWPICITVALVSSPQLAELAAEVAKVVDPRYHASIAPQTPLCARKIAIYYASSLLVHILIHYL